VLSGNTPARAASAKPPRQAARHRGLTLAATACTAAALAAGLPAAAAAPEAAATTYTITDLGSLGLGTTGTGINATGEVTGYSSVTTLVPTPRCVRYGNKPPVCTEHPYHAFVWSNGTMTDLGTLGSGNFSAGTAINLSGEVAGWSDTNADTGNEASLWNGQKMTGLGVPTGSVAAGINDSGQVVGSWGNATTGSQPFLDSNGTITDLPEPGFVATSNLGCQADAINNNGQVAGTCWRYNSKLSSLYADLVLWQKGTVTDLGTLGGVRSTAIAINNNGQIVGYGTTSSGATDGFLYSNGKMTNLGSFNPAAINDNGVMVGGQYIDNGATTTNLNTLIPAGSPRIQHATAINNNGQIVATATGSTDGSVLLTPA
jgi:probable HAF family extracellular repeat protein